MAPLGCSNQKSRLCAPNAIHPPTSPLERHTEPHLSVTATSFRHPTWHTGLPVPSWSYTSSLHLAVRAGLGKFRPDHIALLCKASQSSCCTWHKIGAPFLPSPALLHPLSLLLPSVSRFTPLRSCHIPGSLSLWGPQRYVPFLSPGQLAGSWPLFTPQHKWHPSRINFLGGLLNLE